MIRTLDIPFKTLLDYIDGSLTKSQSARIKELIEGSHLLDKFALEGIREFYKNESMSREELEAYLLEIKGEGFIKLGRLLD